MENLFSQIKYERRIRRPKPFQPSSNKEENYTSRIEKDRGYQGTLVRFLE
jgi:hypothetical protein